MQIHELTTLPSPDGSEYMAVDTGSATYKMKTLFGLISSSVMKVFGSLIANGTLSTGGKNAYNDTSHSGAWLSSGGEIDLTRSASSGGNIRFHHNFSASPTTELYENDSNVLTCSGRFVAKDYTGTQRTPASSAAIDGNRVGYFSTDSGHLYMSAQWGTTGDNYSVRNISVPASDIRLKENISDAEVSALDAIKQIKVRQFDWIQTKEHQSIGVIADELESIDSKLAVGGGMTEDGAINCKSVDTFYLVGYLVKAVQELSAEVERLRG